MEFKCNKLISIIIIMKMVIIIDLLAIVFVSFLIGEILKYFRDVKEAFVNPSQIIKKCNKIKRKTKARMYNFKDNVERNINNKITTSYKMSKTIMKKILLPKEIKISF